MSETKGFSLIELLSTIVIAGIIIAFIIIQVVSNISSGKDLKRKADVEILGNAVVSYAAEHQNDKPVSSTACTINGNCPSSIGEALRPFLATLPSDPNSGSYYTYQSNGTDCTISAVLSDGTTYQYTCTNEPPLASANGSCGTAATTYSYSTTSYPSANFCATGTVSSTPSFPAAGSSVTWICNPDYDGSSASCTASRSSASSACSAISSGSYWTTCGSVSCCYAKASSCPSGWSYVSGWYESTSTTTDVFYVCPTCGEGWVTYRYTTSSGSAPWGHHSTENEGAVIACTYYYQANPSEGYTCTLSGTISPTKIAVGCTPN
jgi:prepilin-type N-terminal cleavage/methylation domain-containing protein